VSSDVEIRLCAEEENEESWALERKVWAPFNWEAEGATGVDYFPELHLVAVSAGKIVGTIDGCPLDWDGDPEHLPELGWTGMIEAARRGFEDLSPRWVGAIGTSVDPEFESSGLAGRLLTALRDVALTLGYAGVAAPVRPVSRWRMPQVSLEEYAKARLSDGRHFDPWVRVHERIGGRIVAVCEQSASFVGDHEQWERWLGMRLPVDGRVLAAPRTVDFLDLFMGVGVLTEGSIWMVHSPHTTPSLFAEAEADAVPSEASLV
jgi:GNAT superfamily N-acetyltransferase